MRDRRSFCFCFFFDFSRRFCCAFSASAIAPRGAVFCRVSAFRSERVACFFLLFGDMTTGRVTSDEGESVAVLVLLPLDGEEAASKVVAVVDVCARTSVEWRDGVFRLNDTFMPRCVGDTGTFFAKTADLVWLW